mgnify:CR=1 FL=1
MELNESVSLNAVEKKLLSDRYGIGKSIEVQNNAFLCNVMKNIRANRELISPDNAFTYYVYGDLGLLWIQTPACRNSKHGNCTICNYWNGNRISDVVDKVIGADIYFTDESILLVNTCGSCLDPYELDYPEQEKLLKWLNGVKPEEIILETHIDTLDRNSILRVRELLPDKKVSFEIGVESVSPDVLFYSINKPFSANRVKEKVELIHSINATCIANVLMGPPFLTKEEQIADSVATIKALLEVGVDRLVLFPVNIKPYTLQDLLYKEGVYQQTRADMLIKVLEHIPEDELYKVDISWYGEHVEKDVISPYYCPKCQTSLKSLIFEFVLARTTEDRKSILLKMSEQVCTCKCEIGDYFQMSYYERLKTGYDLVRKKILL